MNAPSEISNTLPMIEVRFIYGLKYFKLFIDGREKPMFPGYKDGIRKYLKRTYGVDLRTDPRIKKNYTEFKYRSVRNSNGDVVTIKSKL